MTHYRPAFPFAACPVCGSLATAACESCLKDKVPAAARGPTPGVMFRAIHSFISEQ